MRYLLLSSFFVFSGCATSVEVGTPATFERFGQSRAAPASLMALIGQPAEFRDKLVRVEGYLLADWEGSFLYLTQDQCKRMTLMDGLGLVFSDQTAPNWKALESPICRLVLVEGYYRPLSPAEPSPDTVVLSTAHGAIEVTYLVTIDGGS